MGDKNSKYFHRRANARRKVNNIEALKDENGKWLFEAEEIKNVAVNFYKILFAEIQVFREELVMSLPYPLLPVDVINNIGREVSRVEVEDALKSMGPLKAPGPDGPNPCFFSLNGTRLV